MPEPRSLKIQKADLLNSTRDSGHEILDILLHYLQNIYSDTRKYGNNVGFMWDWEMLYELMHPKKSDSAYSAALWHGSANFQSSRYESSSEGIVIPEGARQEMHRYLTMFLRSYGNVQDKETRKHPDNLRFSEFTGHDNWKNVLGTLVDYLNREESLNLLAFFLDQFCVPSSISTPSEEDTAYKFYFEKMERNKRRSHESNKADAINLATALYQNEEYQEEETHKMYMITATSEVIKSDSELCRDPIFYMLTNALKERYPDIRVRLDILVSMISRISYLISVVTSIGHVDVDFNTIERAYVQRQSMDRFTDSLVNLESDPILSDIGRITSMSLQSTHNALMQAKDLSKDHLKITESSSSRFESLLRKIKLIFNSAGISDLSPDDIGLHWTCTDTMEGRNGKIFTYDLKDELNEVVSTLEICADYYSLYWDTDLNFYGFCNLLETVCKKSQTASTVILYIRELEKTGVYIEKDVKFSDIQIEINRGDRDNKISLVRVDLEKFSLFFDPSQDESEFKLDESGFKNITLHSSKIALLSTYTNDLNIIGELFELSGAKFVFGEPFIKALAEKVVLGSQR